MIALSEYVGKIDESKMLSDNTIKSIYKDLFGEEGIKKSSGNNFRSTSKGRAQTEIIRAWFGDDDDQIEKNVKVFLTTGLKISLDDVDLDFGHYPESSGTYPSYKITPKVDISGASGISLDKNKSAYIVCKGGKVMKKQLTPVALGLGNKQFDSIKSIIDTLSKSDVLNDNEVIRSFAINMINKITEEVSGNKYKTFTELAEKKTLSRDLSSLDFGQLDEKSYNNVLNDFGEVLGACFILSKLEGDHNVFFPGESNNAMYDYAIDYKDTAKQADISAKAGAGAKPSATTMAKSIIELRKAAGKKLEFVDDFIVNKVFAIISGRYNNQKISVITSKFALMNVLANDLNDKGAKEILSTLNEYNIKIDDKTFALDIDSIDKVKEEGKLVEMLTKINKLTGFGQTNNKKSYTPERVEEEWESSNAKNIKRGCLCQPFQKYVVNFLNKYYGEQLNACAKNSFGGWQVYMKKKEGKKLNIEIVPMAGDVIYALGEEGSIGDPGLKSISISIKKH